MSAPVGAANKRSQRLCSCMNEHADPLRKSSNLPIVSTLQWNIDDLVNAIYWVSVAFVTSTFAHEVSDTGAVLIMTRSSFRRGYTEYPNRQNLEPSELQPIKRQCF